MKLEEVQKIHDAGLISEEQRLRIVEHFGLKEETSRFMAILLILGGVLAAVGVILMVASNWDRIPAMAKLAGGLLFMVGAYAGGWFLRDGRGDYPRAGEALYLLGAGMFLSNIALVGQIYHLSSRFPNAFLLWWVGIAALPWILKSRPLHVVSLLAFAFWFGCEAFSDKGWIRFGDETAGILLFGGLGLAYYGWGCFLRRTSWPEFAPEGEALGLLGFLSVLFLLTIGPFTRDIRPTEVGTFGVLATLGVVGLSLLAIGLLRDQSLSTQWRATWCGAWCGGVGLMAWALLSGDQGYRDYSSSWLTGTVVSYAAILALFLFCLVTIQVGVMTSRTSMVNMGITFVALDVITTYITLIGSMAKTGLMFLISGVFLIVFGAYLEKKRRSLLRRVKSSHN